MKPAFPYFLAGVGATVVSAAVHGLQGYVMAPSQYLSAIGPHWDDHRLPFPLFTRGAEIVVLTTGFAMLWTWRFGTDLSRHGRALLGLVLVTAVVGITMSATYWIVPVNVANPIAWLMPSRLLNVSEFTAMALLVGLSARYRDNVWIQLNLAALLLITCFNPLPHDDRHAALTTVLIGASMALLVVLAECSRRGIGTKRTAPDAVPRVRRATLALLTAVFVAVVGRAVQQFPQRMLDLPDRTNDAALTRAAARTGLLLTSSDLHLVQLATRRPILLDGLATDGLVYVPAAVPETARIMRHVYGVDLAELQRSGAGGLSPETGQTLWTSRTPAEWQAIRQEFGVTDVLTYPDWTRQLPVLARTENFVLFEIPRSDSR